MQKRYTALILLSVFIGMMQCNQEPIHTYLEGNFITITYLDLLTAIPSSATEVLLTFSTQVASESLNNTHNFAITPSLSILEASIDPDGVTIHLTTESHGILW
jgi:hypothetical protein